MARTTGTVERTRRRAGEPRPSGSRHEPLVGRPSVVRSPAEFRRGEAEHKARQRIAGERAGEAIARRRTAEARAERAEAAAARSKARDESPATRGPSARPRPVRAPRMSTKGLTVALRSFATRNPRRVLLAELLGVIVVTTAGKVTAGEMPRPSDYLAPFLVYLVLGFAAEVGGSTARLAAGIGGLVLLSVVIAHAGGIVKALDYVSFGPGMGPTTFGAQGETGFGSTGQAGEGSGGGGGGSW